MLRLSNFFKTNISKAAADKIGILYICTGKYHIFWEEFYKTAEKYFCKDSEVHYFVFTDQPVDTFSNSRVHLYHQPKLGWPYDTLMRFHIFLDKRDDLEKMDYLFFYNANMKFVSTVKEKDVLPDLTHDSSKLVAVIHPGWYNRQANDFIYERGQNSKAYIKVGEGKNYYQGCLSGGRTKEYLEMCEELKANVDEDESNKVMAIWHDESHINHYFLQHPPKELHPGFAYPESMKVPFKKIAIQLDKAKIGGGHAFLRS